MPRLVICVDCRYQAEHYALGKCRNCYWRKWQKEHRAKLRLVKNGGSK